MTARLSFSSLIASGLLLLAVVVSAPPTIVAGAYASPAGVGAANSTDQARQAAIAGPHVRTADAAARRLLADGIRRSYTIARLADAIEHSDLIVYVHVGSLPDGLSTSQVRLLGPGAGGWRYTALWIDEALLPLGRLQMLGHEMQHAVEIAEAPAVSDSEALEHLYERIGYWGGQDRTYETKRAILAQMQVMEELLAGVDAAGTAAAVPGRSFASASDRRKLYDAYCAVCHGRNGRGRGPAREVLATDPADLTLLAQRNGGTFPRSAVERCILGPRRASDVSASEMPVWPAPPSSDQVPGPAASAGTIAAYVESIQRR